LGHLHQPEAVAKILLIVTERHESYGKGTLPNWHPSKPYLEELRNDRCGPRVQLREALVAV